VNGNNSPNNELPPPPIPILILPATPIVETAEPGESSPTREKEKKGADSSSFDRDREGSKLTKKINQMLKSGVRGVHKSGARLTAVSQKIGSRVVRNGSLRRSNSTPGRYVLVLIANMLKTVRLDFHAVLRQTSYQASSIHSRRRLSSIVQSHDGTPPESLIPPPPPSPQAVPPPPDVKLNSRLAKERRMLSDLWLMSEATFRRLGKIEQAKGAIQEAEVRDENNPAVWVQVCLPSLLYIHQLAIKPTSQTPCTNVPLNCPMGIPALDPDKWRISSDFPDSDVVHIIRDEIADSEGEDKDQSMMNGQDVDQEAVGGHARKRAMSTVSTLSRQGSPTKRTHHGK
jgi:hypothetical protein